MEVAAEDQTCPSPDAAQTSAVGVGPPTLTVQDASDMAGAIVYDCRPPMLPVSLRIKDIGPLPLRRPVASASLFRSLVSHLRMIVKLIWRSNCPQLMSIGDSSRRGSVFRELVSHLRMTRIQIQRVCLACHRVASRGARGGSSGVSVCIAGASCSCSAGRRSQCYVAALSTPGGSQQPDP